MSIGSRLGHMQYPETVTTGGVALTGRCASAHYGCGQRLTQHFAGNRNWTRKLPQGVNIASDFTSGYRGRDRLEGLPRQGVARMSPASIASPAGVEIRGTHPRALSADASTTSEPANRSYQSGRPVTFNMVSSIGSGKDTRLG